MQRLWVLLTAQQVLARELKWVQWKNDGCPSFERAPYVLVYLSPSFIPTFPFLIFTYSSQKRVAVEEAPRPRKRALASRYYITMYLLTHSVEMEKLWSLPEMSVEDLRFPCLLLPLNVC